MKTYLSTLVIILSIIGLFFSCQQKNENSQPIVPPFKEICIKPEVLEIDPTKASSYTTATGTVIEIPENAFLNAKGELISTPVKLKYKSFNSSAQILASGIPMTHADENGQVQNLESAGMFELTGTSNGQPVFIDSKKGIDVHYNSNKSGEYDFFYLRPENEASINEAGLLQIGSTNSTTKRFTWEKLTNNVDQEIDVSAFNVIDTFKLNFDTVGFPETKLLQNLKWKLASNDPKKNPNLPETSWVDTIKWARAFISQPKFEYELIHRYKLGNARWRSHVSIAPFDSSYFFILRNNKVTKLNWEGKTVSSKDLGSKLFNYYGNKSYSSNSKRIIIATESTNHQLLDHHLKTIKSFDDAARVILIDNIKRIITSQNNIIVIYDYNGQLIKTIPLNKFIYEVFTKPIVLPAGFLILKINDVKNTKVEIDVEKELIKLKNYEKNNQLNQYSKIYYNKIKKNLEISEL